MIAYAVTLSRPIPLYSTDRPDVIVLKHLMGIELSYSSSSCWKKPVF